MSCAAIRSGLSKDLKTAPDLSGAAPLLLFNSLSARINRYSSYLIFESSENFLRNDTIIARLQVRLGWKVPQP